MPTFRDEPGSDEVDDSVRIKIGNDEPRIIERYNFHCSVFQQPAAFGLTLSATRGTQEILAVYQPGPMSRVALSIGRYRQFTGELDAVDASGDANRSSIEMRGRDMMARLHDADIDAERSFHNATYEELYRTALTEVGQGHKVIEVSNTANRKIRSGAGVKVTREPVTAAEVNRTSADSFNTTITTKLGETWFEFLTRHFSKLGLLMWADAYGNFVLSRPCTDQSSLFHFFRKRGAQGQANVKSFSFKNDTTRRFSELVVFARNIGRKQGFNHTHGGYKDAEMERLGFNRRRVYRDMNVNLEVEAEFYARKKIAEINRASWQLQYTISGHSAPTVISRTDRAVVIPDVMARVDDDELGIHDDLYIAEVEYKAPPREAVITFMRPQDIILGEFQAEAGAKKAAEVPRKPPEKRSELDILGLRFGTYGFIPVDSQTDKYIEELRKRGESIGGKPLRSPTSFKRGK